ncbi:hypothetical protein CCYA_CCYA16G4080 [Cyanidiococcus yangmingshanensis]|nr:hypothetical protein CCYA_CCYA16G4080 [Cyanidiococcus yangmingshanensis]
MNWMWETPALSAAVAVVVLVVAIRGIFYQREPETRLAATRTGTRGSGQLREPEASRHASSSTQRLVVTVVDDLRQTPLWVQKETLEWSDLGRQWLQRFAQHANAELYFILRVRDDHDSEAWSRAVATLCRSADYSCLDERKFLVCDTAVGAAAMVRQLEPSVHLETLALVDECAARLNRFIPRIVLVGGKAEQVETNGQSIISQFHTCNSRQVPNRTKVALIADPMEVFQHPLWREAGFIA